MLLGQQQFCLTLKRICCPQLWKTDPFADQTKLLLSENLVNNCIIFTDCLKRWSRTWTWMRYGDP